MLAHPWFNKFKQQSYGQLDPSVLEKLLEYKNVSHFKRLAQNILTKMTSDEQLKQMREQFELMDNDGTGMLTLNKIK